MFTSFSTALSALSAFSTGVDVVGNNLANMNTPGFKQSVTSFHDLVTQSLGAGLGETQVGFGVGRPVTLREFSQGAIQATSGPLDMAIQGDGFLVVKDRAGATMYTRGGNLQVDRDGYLLTATGERVQGWTSSSGPLDTTQGTADILIPVGTVKPPVPTGSFSMDMNLDASAPTGTTFSQTIEVYDSLGSSHLITLGLSKTGPNTWDASVTPDSKDLDPAATVTPATVTLKFGSDGTLQSPDLATTSSAPITLDIPAAAWADAAAAQKITWHLFNGSTPRLTQFAQPSAVSANAQDGSPSAQLVKVGIADGGKVLAQYSNGTQTIVGQVAMASVRNPESLIAVGDSNYQLSARSALPAIGVPGTGGRGSILGGAIESSTVDIAKEFTNLIVLQRGYQANSKIVTTVDQMSQDTINLKQ